MNMPAHLRELPPGTASIRVKISLNFGEVSRGEVSLLDNWLFCGFKSNNVARV